MDGERPVLVSVRGLGRRYGGVPALRALDLDVRGGEVLALVGENGAGKSTLARILAGVTAPSEGSIRVAGTDGVLHEVRFDGPRDAERAGIALVHQELNLADNLDVAGNVFLGREPSRMGFLDRRAMEDGARRVLAEVGLAVDPSTPCGGLPIAQRQLVEIAKALSAQARVLLLDEPTSSLSAPEVDRLLAIVDGLRRRGTAVVLVSHHLDEVMRAADRVVVLRDGAFAGELPRDGLRRSDIERLMVGRDLAPAARRGSRGGAPVRLRTDRLVTGHPRARAVGIDVRGGEVVALAGLVGSGRTELLEAIAGIAPHGGTVQLDGAPVAGPASERVRRGIALVPEDRARHGILAEDPVSVNVSLAWVGRPGAGPRIDRAAERGIVRRTVDRVLLRPADPARPVRTLSGGNQQKAVLGRWIAVEPAVLLLDEPTRGVDVGARAEIHAEVRRLADAGTAVLFASSDLEEVLVLADRVIVLHDGAVAGELPVHDATEEAIMHLATGGRA